MAGGDTVLPGAGAPGFGGDGAGGQGPALPAIAALTGERREEYAARLREATLSAHTRRGYEGDFAHWSAWCAARSVPALPATEEALVAYLLYWGDPDHPRAGGDRLLKPSTLERRVAGVRAAHGARRAPWPQYPPGQENLVAATLRYLAVRQHAGRDNARALSLTKLAAAVAALPDGTALGARNRALLLTGFFGALRRSEVIGLDLAHVRFADADGTADEGMLLHIARSKTDQRGQGRDIAVTYLGAPHCPVRAMRAWLAVRGHQPGALFTNLAGQRNGDKGGRLHPTAVNTVLKDALAAIGEDPAVYSAHSLRSGFATTAARLGVPSRLIRQQTGHRSYEMLDRYIQDGSSLRENATKWMR